MFPARVLDLGQYQSLYFAGMGCGCSNTVKCAVEEDRSTEVNLTGRAEEILDAPTATLLTAGAINHSAAKLAETPCNVLEHPLTIKVYFASGEHIELVVQPEDKVCDLSRRLADLKDAGWAILLLGTEPLDESLAASSIPDGQTVTAMLQDDWERPDRLNKTSREQICQSLEMHGVIGGPDRKFREGASIDEAFKQPNWKKFRNICQPIQDFQITVFEFGGQRYVEFDFGLGDNGHGSVHAIGSAKAIMSCQDGTLEPCEGSEERFMDAWVQPHPDEDDEADVPEHDDEADSDDDEDDEADSDDDEDAAYRGRYLPPLLRPLAKATKANKVAEYGCQWS
jgi:hypothetical protein